MIHGRRLQVDTTVVETNIHYPTDNALLADGVRILTRTMKRVAAHVASGWLRVRDRTRSVARRVFAIAQETRTATLRTGHVVRAVSQARMRRLYRELLRITGRVVRQAERVERVSRLRATGSFAPLRHRLRTTVALVQRSGLKPGPACSEGTRITAIKC